MKSIEQIKDEYAKSLDLNHWGDLLLLNDASEINMAVNIVAKEYAQQAVNAKLDRLQKVVDNKIYLGLNCYSFSAILAESINSLKQ